MINWRSAGGGQRAPGVESHQWRRRGATSVRLHYFKCAQLSPLAAHMIGKLAALRQPIRNSDRQTNRRRRPDAGLRLVSSRRPARGSPRPVLGAAKASRKEPHCRRRRRHRRRSRRRRRYHLRQRQASSLGRAPVAPGVVLEPIEPAGLGGDKDGASGGAGAGVLLCFTSTASQLAPREQQTRGKALA